MRKAVLKTDGGSRGNPGLSGLGFILFDDHEESITQGGWYIKQATNNVAEYSALIWGLKNALAAGITHLDIYADSELMVKQINGAYKVKSEDLKPLYMQAKSILVRFEQVTIAHVYREHNKEADRLANEAMDECAPVGEFLVPWEEPVLNLFGAEEDISLPTTASQSQATMMKINDERGISEPLIKEKNMEKNLPYTGPCCLSGETFEHAGGHYEMTVKDHFDASHTLNGYDGPCQYLHGHTWDVEATVAGEHLDSVGILYDFKALKHDLHAVLENFDHRHINDAPPFDIINPTAENLARVIFFELEKTFPSGVFLQEIAIWESPAAKVVFRP